MTSIRQRRALVCDDNVDAAGALAQLLQLYGFSVRVAHDGSHALHVADEFRPDVVLLDLGLPDMSGVDVGRRIKEKPWSTGVVLIAITGWGEQPDRDRTTDAGFKHHLVKPVEPEALLQLLGAELTSSA